jgi:hypothetical protein
MSEHNPVMGPKVVYRLTSADPKAMGRYARGYVVATRSEAERTRAASLQRTPGAQIILEQADTLDATGHVLAPEQRVWKTIA